MSIKQGTPVQVTIEPIKVTVADLGFLRQVSNGNKFNCSGRDSKRSEDKLIFLGLIQHGTIPVCPKAMAAFEKMVATAEKDCREALQQKNWAKLYDAANTLRWERDKPKPREGLLLTEAGRTLLEKGTASTKTLAKGVCL
jgi:hypothetical protein